MNMTTKLSVSSVILAAVLSGCSQQQVMGGSQVAGGSQNQIEGAMPVVSPIAQPRVVKQAPIRTYKRQVAQKRVYTRGPKPTRSVRRSGIGLPSAKPGQCFAKVKVPATYKTQSRKILIQKASSKRVLVRAPQYRWTNNKVQVRKAFYKTRSIPAQYRNNVKRVMVKPAYNTWRKGHGAITRIDNMTGEIMCRVKVPAVYKNVTQRVLVRPARTMRTLVPAVYKTVKQKRKIAPALYKTVTQPARYKTQNYRVKTGGARYVWRSILCQTNAPKNYRKAVVKRKAVVRPAHKKQYRQSGISYQDFLKVMRAKPAKAAVSKPKAAKKKAVAKKKMVSPKKVNKKAKSATKQSIVLGIQKALKAKGFDPGTMDGKMGPGTAAALKAFQSSRGLPIGQLSKDTFRALGLIR